MVAAASSWWGDLNARVGVHEPGPYAGREQRKPAHAFPLDAREVRRDEHVADLRSVGRRHPQAFQYFSDEVVEPAVTNVKCVSPCRSSLSSLVFLKSSGNGAPC